MWCNMFVGWSSPSMCSTLECWSQDTLSYNDVTLAGYFPVQMVLRDSCMAPQLILVTWKTSVKYQEVKLPIKCEKGPHKEERHCWNVNVASSAAGRSEPHLVYIVMKVDIPIIRRQSHLINLPFSFCNHCSYITTSVCAGIHLHIPNVTCDTDRICGQHM